MSERAEPPAWWDRVGVHTFSHRDGTHCLRHPDTGDWWTLDNEPCDREHPAGFVPPMDDSGFVSPGADW